MTKLGSNILFEGNEFLKFADDQEYRKEVYVKFADAVSKKLQDEEFFKKHVHLREMESDSDGIVFQFSLEIVENDDKAEE